MATLPIRRIILYKHGVGYFERRGMVQGETLQLTFPAPQWMMSSRAWWRLTWGTGR